MQVLYERGNISEGTQTVFNSCLVNALKEGLRVKAEFWESGYTLKTLREAEYFRSDEKKMNEELSNECVWPENLEELLSPGEKY